MQISLVIGLPVDQDGIAAICIGAHACCCRCNRAVVQIVPFGIFSCRRNDRIVDPGLGDLLPFIAVPPGIVYRIRIHIGS